MEAEIDRIIEAIRDSSNDLIYFISMQYDGEHFTVHFEPGYCLDIKLSKNPDEPTRTSLSIRGITVVITGNSASCLKSIIHQFMLVTYAFSAEMSLYFPRAFYDLDPTFYNLLEMCENSPLMQSILWDYYEL
ncbi:unnamed protein product [Hymenolepis diminuta]|uniref:Uncharacterized protein n=1 Tax=Hymenolepis diminuta TaxID=6216 RepID=A0A564Z1Z6_HYMDI|nr:unnamed protein product [Hymenolepis diminuta]